jgi:sensor c-di-GMP phosphodiesterase-like protein
MELVAEGVETEDQLNYLSSRKCQTYQGYYFVRPVPADEISHLLQEGMPSRVRTKSLKAAKTQENTTVNSANKQMN